MSLIVYYKTKIAQCDTGRLQLTKRSNHFSTACSFIDHPLEPKHRDAIANSHAQRDTRDAM